MYISLPLNFCSKFTLLKSILLMNTSYFQAIRIFLSIPLSLISVFLWHISVSFLPVNKFLKKWFQVFLKYVFQNMELLTEHLVTCWTSLKINKVNHGFHSVKPGNLLETRSKWMKLVSLNNSISEQWKKNVIIFNDLCKYMVKSLNCNLQSKQLVAPLKQFLVFGSIYIACKFLHNYIEIQNLHNYACLDIFSDVQIILL